MRIFTSDSFLSISDKGDTTGKTLLVIGCVHGDIEKVFPDAKFQFGGGTDYHYRARIDREVVALVMADAVRSIDWPNFKSQVTEIDRLMPNCTPGMFQRDQSH